MTPSMATKFQYVNPLLIFSHSLHVLAPTAILKRDIQLDILRAIFNTADPLYVRKFDMEMLYVVHRNVDL
jgi:hypothetical protein